MMKKRLALFLALVVIVSPSAAWAVPTWVQNLSPWQWYRIPGTALSSVEPSPEPPGGTGPNSKIVAWCGAALKRQGSVYFIGAAGGHGDYAGNEVDAIQLDSENPQWAQLRAPTPTSQIINASQFYLDRRPSPTHTYWASVFINARNRLLVMPSPGMGWDILPPPPAGWPYAGDPGYSFSFNVAANDWDQPEFIARYSGGGDFTGALVAKHPYTEDVYYNRYPSGWWRWTQSTNTWTKLNNNNNPSGNYSGAAIDPVRDRMLVIGSFDGSFGPRVLDLAGNTVPVTFTGLGSSALTLGGYPGVLYDEANDRFLVVFNSGGVRVRRVNPATWAVDEPSVSGSAPASRQNGILNSVQYAPELGGIVIANSYTGDMYFMKTSSGGGTSDTTPPSAPAGLQSR